MKIDFGFYMQRILFVVPSLSNGGAEKTVANLSLELSKRTDCVIYIAVLHDSETKYRYGGNILFLPEKKRNSKISKFFHVFVLIKELKEIKKRYKIDCSISFLIQADVINILTRKYGKTMISIRNMDSILFKNKIYKLLSKFTCKKADKIIAISKKVKDDLFETYKLNQDKIEVIYNPAMTIDFSNKPVFLPEDKFKIISIGRLTEQKGQWHLIRAFKKVIIECPDAKLYILGEGELKNYLKRMIYTLKLENHINLLGYVDNPYDFLKASNLFVFPSLYEGLGNSILEALTCGIPIISSDCDAGPREILSPKTDYLQRVKDKIEYGEFGVLVPCCDDKLYKALDALTEEESILAEAIINMIKNPDLRKKYKDQSKKRCDDFRINEITNKWWRLISENVNK